ncbi:hypothetical protein RQ86_19255, partial [Acinetobacter baumannii]
KPFKLIRWFMSHFKFYSAPNITEPRVIKINRIKVLIFSDSQETSIRNKPAIQKNQRHIIKLCFTK